jgi:anaerobic magnesium-protoporphyrin IX monomethyl ester cyclase
MKARRTPKESKKILFIALSNYTQPAGNSALIEGKSHKPQGILSLATYLRDRKGYRVACIDKRIEDPVAYIKENAGELLFVGFSTMSAAYNEAKNLLQQVKALSPDLFCVAGGAHPSAACRETVADGFDVAVAGEGEIICGEIADALQNAGTGKKRIQALSKIQGIAFRDANNEIVFNQRTDFIEDLDTLPIVDRSLLPSARYSREHVTVFTSRGCTGKCFFCQSGQNLFGRKIRQRSVRSVLNEIRALLADGCKFITFLDDCLLFNEAWVCEFCDAVKKEGLRFGWVCETRAQFITESIIMKIIDAGCRGVNIGFESGSDNTLKFLRKGATVALYKKCLDVLHRYGLQFHSYIIMGSPEETKKDLDETVKFVREARPAQVAVSRLTPIYGCELFDYLAKKNLMSNVDEQSFYRNCYPIKCAHLTMEDLDYYETEVYRAMYIPGEIPDGITGSAFIFDDEAREDPARPQLYSGTLRVKNNTNFHWIAYPGQVKVPFSEIKNKTLRDHFYQQISGLQVVLYLDWSDAGGTLIRRDCVGHLVGNVPMGECGTFVFAYAVPDAGRELYSTYTLVLPEKNSILVCRSSIANDRKKITVPC